LHFFLEFAAKIIGYNTIAREKASQPTPAAANIPAERKECAKNARLPLAGRADRHI